MTTDEVGISIIVPVRSMTTDEAGISIIVPVLNEAPGIAGFLAHLQPYRRDQGIELIVVDGGSSDDSLSLAAPLVDIMVHSPAGRALQMNAGAAAASRSWLLFLHADTMLDPPALQALQLLLADGVPLWGRFDIRLGDNRAVYRLIGAMMNLRSRLTGIATGDQGIFMHRELFRAVGGYPSIPLMEDVAISAALKRLHRPVCLRQRLVTSARRWRQHGVWRTIFLMWALRAAYRLGVAPERLNRWYYRRESS